MGFPRGKYNIIYADPPWQYKDRLKMQGANGLIRGAESFYATMNIQAIKNLPLQSITKADCYLFLWVTMPMLEEGLSVIKAWGFKYKTCAFTWVKKTKNNKNHFGMGHYTRGNAELCLLGVQGKLQRQNGSVRQIVESQVRGHSQKPSVIRDKITQLYGELPRIELFAREKVKGWDTWGKEIEH